MYRFRMVQPAVMAERRQVVAVVVAVLGVAGQSSATAPA
jgi:hypothetical protein